VSLGQTQHARSVEQHTGDDAARFKNGCSKYIWGIIVKYK